MKPKSIDLVLLRFNLYVDSILLNRNKISQVDEGKKQNENQILVI